MQTVSVPQVLGRTDAQEEASHVRLVKEARAPYQGEFDGRYVVISQEDIRAAREIYNSVIMARTARKINNNGFRQGGMTIQIGNAAPKDYKTTDLFGNTVMEWALRVDADLEMYGFAVATYTTADPSIAELFSNLEDTFNSIKEVPQVLDPAMLDIYYHRNILGEHNWIVRQRTNQRFDIFSQTEGLLGPIVPRILVFTTQIKEEAPSSDGRLHSRMLALRDDYASLKQMRMFALRAEERRSAPWVITERVASTKDPVMHGIIPDYDMDCGRDQKCDNGVTSAEKLADRLVRNTNMFTEEQRSALSNFFVMQTALAGYASVEDDRVDLPAERKLARQVMAEAPANLKEMEIQFEQKVLHLFGIPPAMVHSESAHGKMVANENALVIFSQHMRAKKHELLTPIRIMLRAMYARKLRMKYLVQKGRKTNVDYKQFKSETRITVALHGLPPEERLDELYLQGTYTYEAYIAALGAIHGIPPEHFEKTPAISREDLLTGGKDTLSRDQMKQDKVLKTAEMASKEKQAKAKAKAKPKAKR